MRIVIFAPLVAALAVAVACRDQSEVVAPTPTPTGSASTVSPGPTPGRQVEIISQPLYSLPLGDSVKTLTQGSEVITGRVTGIVLPYDPRVGYGGVPPETAPPGNPKAKNTPTQEEINRPPGRLFTVFSVEVTDPGSTNLKAGSVVNVGQSGGIWEGIEYRVQGDPVLELGRDYLLAISREDTVDKLVGNGYFLGPPFALFRIDGDQVHPIDETWSGMPAVKEITGQTSGAAMSTILQARAGAASEPTIAPQ